MKLMDIIAESSGFDTFDELAQFLDKACTNHTNDIKSGLVKMDQVTLTNIAHKWPQIMYKGPMVRLVMLPGSRPNVKIQELTNHSTSAGLQSFARTEHGMDVWADHHAPEPTMTDVTVTQVGVGISIEAVFKLVDKSRSWHGLEQAAEAEEVLALYNPSAKIVHIHDYTQDDEHGDYDESDYPDELEHNWWEK